MSSVVISGNTSGTITLDAPAVAGTTTLTLPATSGTVLTSATTQSGFPPNIAGNGPAFSAWASVATSVANATFTKVLFQTEEFDTNNNFTSSTFTPTVAGYYQVNASIYFSPTTGFSQGAIYKSGSAYKYGVLVPGFAGVGSVCTANAIVYCNGTTDTIEIYGIQNSGGAGTALTGQALTYFQAAMIRGG
jgi:hypothetical protein